MEDWRAAAATLYWEAFQRKLGPILGNKDGPALLADVPSRSGRDRSRGTRLLGLAGVQYSGRAFVGITWTAMRKRYGVLRGALKLMLLAMLDRKNGPNELVMDGIVVSPTARGQGIGSQLLDAVIERAAREGMVQVRLDVVDTNPGARRLYERVGFQAMETTQTPWMRRRMGFGASTTMIKQVHPGTSPDVT